MAAGSLTRRVVFYGWEDVFDDHPFSAEAAAAALENIGDEDWALESSDGFVTGVLVDQHGSPRLPTLLRAFRLRSGDDLPHVLDSRRRASPLELQQNEAVTDWTHVVIWPDKIAAHDARRDAPAVSRVAQYLRELADERVRFFPLYDRSLLDQLEQLEEIKAIDIKFQVSRAEQLEHAQGRNMIAALLAVGRDADALTVQTRVSVGQSRSQFLSNRVRREVHQLAENAEELLDNLVISGIQDGQAVTIDVLRRRLALESRVRRSRSLGNAPDPTVMYRAIVDARQDLEGDRRLQRAVRIR